MDQMYYLKILIGLKIFPKKVFDFKIHPPRLFLDKRIARNNYNLKCKGNAKECK
jgi:hypothetical protein